MDIIDLIKMKKFQFYQMMQKPIPDKELKITSEKHEKHIELIGWRWSEKNLRNLWLFTLFLFKFYVVTDMSRALPFSFNIKHSNS